MVKKAVRRTDTPDQIQALLMTVEEVADYLRVSKASVYRLVKGKGIPVSKIGRQLRFRKGTVDRWLSEKENDAAIS